MGAYLMAKPKKQGLGKVYFTQETEDAIVQYNKTTDLYEREILYRQYIQAPFDKLAENVINRFKFPYMEGTFDEVKSEVVSFLVINLHKFTEGKGKAFSYFSVIAKNYLILHNDKAYKEEKRSIYLIDKEDDAFSLEETLVSEPEQDEVQSDMRDFINILVAYWDFNLTKIFRKKRDIEIATAVIELLRRIDKIDNFNKKALYLLIREMTNYKTSHITKVINKMKVHVFQKMKEFRRTGHISDPSTYFTFKK
jgi:hypothetical protein